MSSSHRGILDNARSPHVRFRSIGIGDCRWTHGFWAEKTKLCAEVIVPHMGELLRGDIGHAYNNFKIAAGLMEGEAKGMLWHDGDFYKWMEAALYISALDNDSSIVDELDEIVAVFEKAQRSDGYIHTHNQIFGKPHWAVVTDHELYNGGHFIAGAVVHHRITGKTNWLNLAVKHAEHLYTVFVPREERLARFGFNPSQIMGLVELYREVGDPRFLELAGVFVDMRGSVPLGLHESVPYWFTGDQCQMRTPLREETEAVGHCVTGFYLYAGAADVYAETGEKAVLDALERIWSSAERKMYLTGAFGQVHHGSHDDYNAVHEAFVDDYLMPNSTAYNETCANIASAMFNWRMLGINGNAAHADHMERVLYNSAMAGISTDGLKYFYANPLRMNHGQREYSDRSDCTESADREPYIECFCCPPNLARTIAKVSGWAYSLTDDGVAVNLYGANTLDTRLADGSVLRLSQETAYPWDGAVNITIDECRDDAFDIMLRIPAWAERASLRVNGSEVEVAPGSYASVSRVWKKGDVISLEIPMPVNLVEGHPRIEEVRNQVAIQRGPLVYCVESPDLPEGTGILDVYFKWDTQLSAEFRPGFLGGVTVIRGNVLVRSTGDGGMYRTVNKPEWRTVETTFVPYFAWSNRGTAEMTVFMPVIWS